MARKPQQNDKTNEKPERGVDIPGRPERDGEGKEHTPAHGPGGAKPESGLRGTAASSEPGAINSPYPGDDMNEDQSPMP